MTFWLSLLTDLLLLDLWYYLCSILTCFVVRLLVYLTLAIHAWITLIKDTSKSNREQFPSPWLLSWEGGESLLFCMELAIVCKTFKIKKRRGGGGGTAPERERLSLVHRSSFQTPHSRSLLPHIRSFQILACTRSFQKLLVLTLTLVLTLNPRPHTWLSLSNSLVPIN